MKLIKIKCKDSKEQEDRAIEIVKEIKSGKAYSVGPFRLFFKLGKITASAPRKGEATLSDKDATEFIKSAILANKPVSMLR